MFRSVMCLMSLLHLVNHLPMLQFLLAHNELFFSFLEQHLVMADCTTYSQDECVSIQNADSLLSSVLKIMLWSSLAVHRNVLKGRGVCIYTAMIQGKS